MTQPESPLDAPGSQAERTALAWSRTALSLAAVAGLVGIHAFIARPSAVTLVPAGLVAGALLLSASHLSRVVWRRAMDGLLGRGPATDGAITVSVAGATVLVALWAVIAIVIAR